MGSEFAVYFRLGVEHIADIRGYDHILFVAALTVAYSLLEWRRLLILVTAFTVGHSITLALATIGVVSVNTALIEFLIPATIFVTSVFNVADSRPACGALDTGLRAGRHHTVLYLLAGGFGLIHGLGFSSFLRTVLGGEEGIVVPLFAFNVGLELGQILIVAVVFALGALLVKIVRMARRDWMLVVSGAAGGIAITLMLERLPG